MNVTQQYTFSLYIYQVPSFFFIFLSAFFCLLNSHALHKHDLHGRVSSSFKSISVISNKPYLWPHLMYKPFWKQILWIDVSIIMDFVEYNHQMHLWRINTKKRSIWGKNTFQLLSMRVDLLRFEVVWHCHRKHCTGRQNNRFG